jgi:hypothetical protein
MENIYSDNNLFKSFDENPYNLDTSLDDMDACPEYIPVTFPEYLISDNEVEKNISDVDKMIKDCLQIKQEIKLKALNDKLNKARLRDEELNKNCKDEVTKVRNKIKLKELPKTPKPIYNKPNTHVSINKTGNAEFERIMAKLAQQDKALKVIQKDENVLNDIEKADKELEGYLNDIDNDIDEVLKMGEEMELFINKQNEINKQTK